MNVREDARQQTTMLDGEQRRTASRISADARQSTPSYVVSTACAFHSHIVVKIRLALRRWLLKQIRVLKSHHKFHQLLITIHQYTQNLEEKKERESDKYSLVRVLSTRR